jgi:hypothetical protein
MLHDAEAVGDVRGIGERSIGGGIGPVPWKSENAADWFTNTPPVRLMDSATPASSATSMARRTTSSSVEYTDSVSAPWPRTASRAIGRLSSVPACRSRTRWGRTIR